MAKLTSLEPLFVVRTSEDSCFRVCVRLREASASARVSSCGLSPVAVAVVVDAVDVLASHEHGAAVGVGAGAGVAISTGSVTSAAVDAAAVAEATAEGGGGGETSSVVSIELSSLSSDTLRTRVIG